MRKVWLVALSSVFVAILPAAGNAALQDENILLPVPNGFTAGFRGRQGTMDIQEFVPSSETVKDWSQMVTEQIFHNLGKRDPDQLPQGMSQTWPSGCPGGESQRIARANENGYEISVWMFVCPNNPATGKPENMWMKVVSGADALYSVQYAYRQPLTKEMVAPTMAYLKSVLVCDTRGAEHPCPKGT